MNLTPLLSLDFHDYTFWAPNILSPIEFPFLSFFCALWVLIICIYLLSSVDVSPGNQCSVSDHNWLCSGRYSATSGCRRPASGIRNVHPRRLCGASHAVVQWLLSLITPANCRFYYSWVVPVSLGVNHVWWIQPPVVCCFIHNHASPVCQTVVTFWSAKLCEDVGHHIGPLSRSNWMLVVSRRVIAARGSSSLPTYVMVSFYVFSLVPAQEGESTNLWPVDAWVYFASCVLLRRDATALLLAVFPVPRYAVICVHWCCSHRMLR